MGVNAKTATKQVNNNGRYKKGSGSIGNWEALMELYWDFHSKVTASVGDCLDQGGIFRR